MEFRRIELDDEHDEVTVYNHGTFIGAGACLKSAVTEDVARRIIDVWLLGV